MRKGGPSATRLRHCLFVYLFLPASPLSFIYSTTGPFIIIIFSFSLIIPLSSRLSLLEFRSSPFHPLIAPIHAPFLSVIFSFPFATLFPSLLSAAVVRPIYPTGGEKEEESHRACRELYQQGDA